MADQSDVRACALTLPDVTEHADTFAFSVHGKGFAWVWLERPVQKKARVPNPEVLGVRVAGEEAKQELIAADPTKFFTEPHYNGFPAILVRLPAVDRGELMELLTDAWRCQAPKKLHGQLP